MEKKGCSASAPAGSCSTEKADCWVALVKGMFIGGVVMFIYLSVSWMVLPWHKGSMMSFENEKAVAAVLAKNAPKSGLYVLPNMEDTKTPAVTKPFVFMSVDVNGADMKDMKKMLGQHLLLCLFSALLLTCLLKKSSCCGCPVAFSFKIGLLVALAHYVPGMICYHFPLNYSLVGMLDDVLSFTLAGMAISCCVLKKSGGCSTGTPAKKAGCH